MDTIEHLQTKINEKEYRIKELENQKKKILSEQNNTERKKRTRQLIQMGALTEKFFNIHDVAALQEFYTKMNKK